MAVRPPTAEEQEVYFGSGALQITRRVEIYEQDGATLWKRLVNAEVKDVGDSIRLLDGSVTVDVSRDERRTCELSLDNTDGLLTPQPKGFWYDKVIKVWRGFTWYEPPTQPLIGIFEDDTASGVSTPGAYVLWKMFSTAGYKRVKRYTGYTSWAQLRQDIKNGKVTKPDICVFDSQAWSLSKSAFAAELYAAGFRILSGGNDNNASTLPFVTAAIAKSDGSTWTYTPRTDIIHPILTGWTTFNASVDTGQLITGLRASAVGLATYSTGYTLIAEENPTGNGARWVHIHDSTSLSGTQAVAMFTAVADWLNPRDHNIQKSWECQIGTFMIDSIDEEDFPSTVAVQGRDYTKKMMLSKILRTTTFKKGSRIEDVIKALALNSGVTKYKIPGNTGHVLGKDYSYDRGTPRWDIANTIAKAFGYELFFDATGRFIMREWEDPVKSPITFTFQTGNKGNLIKFKKSTNDSRIYNHIMVIGQHSDQTPIYSEAKNTDPHSPTNIDELGDRSYEYVSGYIHTQEQADRVAAKLLAHRALEEYNVDMEAIVVPWLEAGDICMFLDPDAASDDPTRFLLSNFQVPLQLGSMQVTAKRVTVVG
jgi:hypothetical protein